MAFWSNVASAATGATPFAANAAQGTQGAIAGGIGPAAGAVNQWMGQPSSGTLWNNLGGAVGQAPPFKPPTDPVYDHPWYPGSTPSLPPDPGTGTFYRPPTSGIAPVPWGSGSENPRQNPYPGGPLPQPGMGGDITRQGSQAFQNGQVIGHYGDQNQLVYNQGQGPQQTPGQLPHGPWDDPNWRPMMNDYIPPPPGWTPPAPPPGGWPTHHPQTEFSAGGPMLPHVPAFDPSKGVDQATYDRYAKAGFDPYRAYAGGTPFFNEMGHGIGAGFQIQNPPDWAGQQHPYGLQYGLGSKSGY